MAVFCFCNLYLSEEGWGQGKGVFGQGTGCAAAHKVVHMQRDWLRRRPQSSAYAKGLVVPPPTK